MKSQHALSMMTLAVASMIAGCASSGGSTPAVANPYSSSGGSSLGEVHVNTMRVFGDSYSDPSFTNSIGTINWATQLQARGTVVILTSMPLVVLVHPTANNVHSTDRLIPGPVGTGSSGMAT